MNMIPRKNREMMIPRRKLSPLNTYLRDIDKTKLLSAEEERHLARLAKAGDSQARDHLVRANLRSVVAIAKRYIGKGLELDDLIENGNLGLLRAVDLFDPAKNTRLTTYATYWIKNKIRLGLHNTATTIRTPVYMRQRLTKVFRATSKLQDELERPVTREEVAKCLNLSEKQSAMLKQGSIHACNMVQNTVQAEGNLPSDEIVIDSNHNSFDELVIDASAVSPDKEMVEAEDLTHLRELICRIDPREAHVLRMRFGLDDGQPNTLKEIGERLGLTRERVRQIESEALGKLRERM